MNFRNYICLIAVLAIWTTATWGQESRNIDGTGNNLNNPDFGASHTQLARIMTNGYADGVSAPSGADRPNPRAISNAVFSQSTSISDGMGLSDFLWTFGQFIDHDIVEVENNPAEPVMIPVDFNDQWFNPGGNIPNVNIPMFRSMPAAGTGTDANNPRGHLNNITAWLDGSAVYGSDLHRANWLRTFEDGKLKTSAGNLLPWNTYSGEKDSDVDPNAPFMADDVGLTDKIFVAGDIRANEQPLLIAVHTVFVREHNRLCDELIAANPNWNDEEIYQAARRWVGAFFQAIVFQEWLPAMGVHLPDYAGYNPGLNPAITNVFSAAAFRLGHTLLNGNIQRIDSNGDVIPEGNLTLAQAFFNPAVVETVGIDVYFKGMAVQVEQALDCKLIDDVRNFLFGPPGAGGLDLAAININRGRERGLPDINAIRADLGLAPFSSFDDINDDGQVSDELESIYGELSKIDPWVGMLAEAPMTNALFGETIMEIMIAQFQALRDGDRFYYQNDPAFNSYDIMTIENTSFKDIIMRNTEITLMQENVFLATSHGDICGSSVSAGDVTGTVKTTNGDLLSGSEIKTFDAQNVVIANSMTSQTGDYVVEDLSTCNYYTVKGERPTTDFRNGITNLDIIQIARHILHLSIVDDPIRLASADTDGDLQITTFDLVEIQRLLLHYTSEFPNQVPSWRLVPQSVVSSGVDPYPAFFNPNVDLGLLQDNVALDWIGYKMGDFSLNASANTSTPATDRNKPFVLEFNDIKFDQGAEVTLELSREVLNDLYGVQLSLAYDASALSLSAMAEVPGLMSKAAEGKIDFSWFQTTLNNDQKIELTFRTHTSGSLSEFIQLGNHTFTSNVVDANFSERPLNLAFDGSVDTPDLIAFEVFQNNPNPFKNQTTISWFQPIEGTAKLEVFSSNGSRLFDYEGDFNSGYQQMDLAANEIGSSGLLFYRISTDQGAVTRRMMLIQ